MIYRGRKASLLKLWVVLFVTYLLCHGCATTRIDSRDPAGVFLISAEEALTAGEYDKAELILERALRVEPRRASHWHAMGRVRFGQQNYAQAVQFCLKSNSLAGRDMALIRKNNELITQANIRLEKPGKAGTPVGKYP